MRQRIWFSCLLACVVAAAVALPGRASANIVTNGGFETGDFTGWTAIGNSDFNGVLCPGVGSAVEGSCEAFFGPIGTTGGVRQTLATAIGQGFTISFALIADGGIPSSLEVDFGGQVLLARTDLSAATQTFTLSAVATSASTDLTFLFRDDTGFMALDNVQVSAVPEPASLSLLSLGLAGLAARRRRGRKR